MREADDVEGGNAPSKIAMLDLETKRQKLFMKRNII